jgi:hypothetical protein
VFVSSTAGPFPPQDACCDVGEGVISAFDGSTGEMLWQTLAGRGAVGVYNMVAAPGGLFVPVRSTERATNDWDFGMHAYATHPRRGAARSPTPYLLTETGTSGARRYDLALDPAVNPGAHGLIPAAEQPDVVVDDPTDDLEQAMATGIGVTFHTVSVPEGTRSLRIGLYDEETDGNDDLDLYVFDADGNLVGVSFTFTSEETVDLPTPAAGDYTVVVHGFETDGPDASYTLFTWALGSAPAGNMTVAPAAPGPGGSPRMTVQWSGLTAGTRYFGAVSYSDATGEVGQTLVSIHPAP